MSKVNTIAYGSVKEYATVPARLKEFRQKNPRAGIKTTPTFGEDGSLTFEAEITVDRGDESTATATGHAHYTAADMKQKKAFEKVETIAVGRALANLGYLNNGQIATTEEMLEFEEYRLEKYEDEIAKATSVEDLMAVFQKMNAEEKKTFTEALSEKKKELLNATAN